MTVKVAVIYYSATGTVHALAQAVTEGATATGAAVRLRRVAELAPDSAIDQNPTWRRHAAATRSITEASVEDLAWADAFAFGTPTRFGAPAAQLKPDASALAAARYQGQRLAQITIRLLEGRRATDAAAGDGNGRGTSAVSTSQTA
jgi:NAD(P)H-dependent FMN reductase